MENSAENHYKIIRGPYQLTVDITNKCNLRCLHCYNFSGENICVDEEMTDEELTRLIKDVADMNPLNLCFCGGEPLLRKDILLKLIKILADKNIQISFVTNGLLLTEEVAKELKGAGLSRAQVSVDGIGESHDRLRGRKGCFEKAVQALKNLNDVHIQTGVAFTPTSWNTDEIDQIVDLCLEFNVSELRIQATMPIGRGEENTKSILPTELQYRKMIKRLNARRNEQILKDGKLRIEWGDPVDHFIRLANYVDECCAFVSIKADGSIAPSIYLPLTLGNVKKHSLKEYWEHGLGRMWRVETLKEVSNKVRCIKEMNMDEIEMPKTFKEKDIQIDIVEQNIL